MRVKGDLELDDVSKDIGEEDDLANAPPGWSEK